MEELENKYIDLLLGRCLNFNNSKCLFISYDKVNKDFVLKVIEKAHYMGIEEIILDEEDIYCMHEKLLNSSLEEIENDSYFNKEKWDYYAKRNASFLMLETEFPNVMEDVLPEKIAKAKYINRITRKVFREKESTYQIPWCIAALPNKVWADSIFPNDKDSYEKLFKVICKMCMVDTVNPILSWNNYIIENQRQVNLLNDLKIKKLHYKNNLGTDLIVEFADDIHWCGVGSDEEKDMLVNMPSYEIFTTPDFRKTEGIVYSSKPLVYGGGVVEEFYLKFSKGKVVDYGALKGYEILKDIIGGGENSAYLGEVALVDYDSPISNTNLVFGTTLFDENAACHLALGDGFPSCLENGLNMKKEELLEKGVNQADNHVDFMIGTADLEIEAETNKGTILIFKDGNFCIDK